MGSKERRDKHGIKSDDGTKVFYKEHQQQVLHIEIKSPSVVSEDNDYHIDFVKFGNIMKDEIDVLLNVGFDSDVFMLGLLIIGWLDILYN